MSLRERIFWYIVTAVLATAVLSCTPFLPGQLPIDVDPWNVDPKIKFLPVVCFPLSVLVVGVIRSLLIKEKPLDFVINSFLFYQVTTFICLLCVLYGVEPFIRVAARGASLGMSAISFNFQCLALLLALFVVAALSLLNGWKFPPSAGRRRFLVCFLGAFWLGLLFNFMWLILPPYEDISDYFGNMADWHIMEYHQYSQAKEALKNTEPGSPDYIYKCISMMQEANSLSYRDPSRIEEVRTIGETALQKCSDATSRERIYETLSRYDNKNALKYRAKQLDILEELGEPRLFDKIQCITRLGELHARGDSQKACEYFDLASQLRRKLRNCPEAAMYSAACAFKHAGNYADSKKYFLMVINAPSNASNQSMKKYSSIGMAEILYKQGKIVDACPYVEKYMEQGGPSTLSMDMDGQLIVEMINKPEVLNIWPRTGRLKIARLMLNRHYYKPAYSLFNNLYSTVPPDKSDVERHICAEGLAVSLFGMDKFSEARPYFEEAVASMPKAKQDGIYSEFPDFIQKKAALRSKLGRPTNNGINQ